MEHGGAGATCSCPTAQEVTPTNGEQGVRIARTALTLRPRGSASSSETLQLITFRRSSAIDDKTMSRFASLCFCRKLFAQMSKLGESQRFVIS